MTLAISGCTNPTATNYNPLATIDDGSCIGGLTPGCCDPTATNFDPLATCDDGSCLYVGSGGGGCIDPTAMNYDPAATVDNQTCCYENNFNILDPASSTGDFVAILWSWFNTAANPYTFAFWVWMPGYTYTHSLIGPGGVDLSASNNYNTAIVGPSGFNVVANRDTTLHSEGQLWDTENWVDGTYTWTLTNERGCSSVTVFDVVGGVGTMTSSSYGNNSGIKLKQIT